MFAPDGVVSEEDQARFENENYIWPGYAEKEPEEIKLCRSCGWNAYLQGTSSYVSRIRILHARDNIALWEMGSRWLIRAQPNNKSLGNDYMTYQFLCKQGVNIPLVKHMQRLSEPTDEIQFTLTSRAQGVTLDSIWTILSPEEKSNYRGQMANALKLLRQFTSKGVQKVDGSPLDDTLVGLCVRRQPPTCKKIGYTTNEWFENIAAELRCGLSRLHKTKDATIIEQKLQELKITFQKQSHMFLPTQI
ncbi:hypothetical protein G7Y89_g11449 [Cudoniella acicularis]|uniref:Aminoglycoside phosphotransferase domain-containing protein n=1 Tax=Cudoniella acicularis TaxID=354080 RepID=A0A8H4VY07_9HELO|nr:hypothetical protein G7Y89_g11449 [Cudoniella acicularis]